MRDEAIAIADQLNLPNRHRQVLLALAEARTFISVSRIADKVYEDDPDGGPDGAESCIHAYVNRLRARLRPTGHRIITIRTLGYRLELEKPMSPTDIHSDPSCSFCGRSKKECRLLIAAPENRAFICELCVVETVNTSVQQLRTSGPVEGVLAGG